MRRAGEIGAGARICSGLKTYNEVDRCIRLGVFGLD